MLAGRYPSTASTVVFVKTNAKRTGEILKEQAGGLKRRPSNARSDVFDKANAGNQCEILEKTQHGRAPKWIVLLQVD